MSGVAHTSVRAGTGQSAVGESPEREMIATVTEDEHAAALDASILVRRGDFVLDVRLRVEPGEIVALLGPNGCGKSTFLHAVAGLLPLESGTVTTAGRVLSHRDVGREGAKAGPGRSHPTVQVEPEHRGIGLLGQDPLLFPHLSAMENIAFGRRAQGVPKAAARRESLDWLQAVQLPEFSERRPAQLSGGQQQRVAIARALAAHPSLLLLDEPMAALDVQSAPQIRLLLREQLGRSGTAAVLVTHDVLDAIVLADRIVILDDGRIVDQGVTTEVLARPRNRFVADLVGVNLVTGVLASGELTATDPEGNTAMRLSDGRLLQGHASAGRVPARSRTGAPSEKSAEAPAGRPARAGGVVHGVFRPAAVRVERADVIREAPGSASAAPSSPGAPEAPRFLAVDNRWAATVIALEPVSGGIRIRTDDPAGILAELTAVEVAALDLEPGCCVHLSVAPGDVAIHPATP